MGNINIDLPDDVHRQLKLDAVANDSTLKDHVIKLLDEEVDE